MIRKFKLQKEKDYGRNFPYKKTMLTFYKHAENNVNFHKCDYGAHYFYIVKFKTDDDA